MTLKAAPVIQAAQDNDLAAVQRLLAEVRRGSTVTRHGRMLLNTLRSVAWSHCSTSLFVLPRMQDTCPIMVLSHHAAWARRVTAFGASCSVGRRCDSARQRGPHSAAPRRHARLPGHCGLPDGARGPSAAAAEGHPGVHASAPSSGAEPGHAHREAGERAAEGRERRHAAARGRPPALHAGQLPLCPSQSGFGSA